PGCSLAWRGRLCSSITCLRVPPPPSSPPGLPGPAASVSARSARSDSVPWPALRAPPPFAPARLTPLPDGNSGKAEAEEVVPVRRRVPDAVRRLAVDAVVVPTAAPVHSDRAPKKNDLTRAGKLEGRDEMTRAEWPSQQSHHPLSKNLPFLRIVVVGAPLPHITVHVAQAQFIRRVRAHPRGASEVLSLWRVAERIIAVEVGLIGGEVVARLVEVEVVGTLFLRSGPSPTSVFPFRFRRQAVQIATVSHFFIQL